MGHQPLILQNPKLLIPSLDIRHWTLVIFSVVYLLLLPAFAQTSFDSMTIGVGARSLGMGRTFMGVGEDGDALFSNPAGLGKIDSLRISSMSGNLLEEVRYLVLGGVYPLGKQSAVGVGYVGDFISGIELRDIRGNPTIVGNSSGQANFSHNAYFFAYGRKLIEGLSAGLNLKYFAVEGSTTTAGDGKGWNVDVGLLQNSLDWINFGVVAQNLLTSSKLNYQNGEIESFPPKFKAGLRLSILGKEFNSKLVYPYDLTLSFDAAYNLKQAKPLATHLGIEFNPNDYLALRTGIDEGDVTAGVGLKFFGVGLHYAYHFYGDIAENAGHYFSLTFDERGWPAEGLPDVFIGSI